MTDPASVRLPMITASSTPVNGGCATQCDGNGYASSLTAAASQDQLDRGRRFMFLFTDLSNPTSNKIYQAIGYRPVCDVDQYLFADA